MIRGELFFFKSGYVWRIRDGRLQGGYPALASRHWRGIPYNIDAAYEDTSGNIWFFKGKVDTFFLAILLAGQNLETKLLAKLNMWFPCVILPAWIVVFVCLFVFSL